MSFGHFGPWSIGEWYILSYCGQSCRLGLQHLRYKYVTFRSLRPPFSKTKGSLFLRDLKLKDGRSKTYVTCSLVTCKMSPTVYLFVCSFVYVFTYLINSLFTYPFSLFLQYCNTFDKEERMLKRGMIQWERFVQNDFVSLIRYYRQMLEMRKER